MIQKSDIIRLPNLISYFRIGCVFYIIYAYLYLDIERSFHLYTLIGIALCTLSDFLDGLIARSFDMITDLGKIIDPIADKLYQLTLSILLCIHYRLMIIMVVIVIIENATLLFYGLYIYKKTGRHIKQARMIGKIATAIYFIGTFLLIAYDFKNSVVYLIGISLMALSMLVAFISYFNELKGYAHG